MWEYLVEKIKPLPKSDDSDIKAIKRSNNPGKVKAVEQNPDDNYQTHQKTSSHLKRALQCPVCHSRMNREYISNIEIDRCEKCGGIFLDKGELEMIHPSGHSSYAPDSGKTTFSQKKDRYLVYTPHGLSNKVRD